MSRFDLIIDGIGVMLYRPSGRGRAIRETSIPALAQETLQLADEPLTLDTFHLGMGYSQRYVPGTYAHGTDVDCRFPRLAMPGPRMNAVTLTDGTAPRCAADYDGNIYVGAGRYVFEVDPANPATTPLANVRDLGAGNRAWSMVVFRGNLLVGVDDGSGTTPGTPQDIHSFDGTTWSTLTGIARASLATVWWDTDYRLVGSDTTTTVAHVAGDPSVAGNWSSAITIGDAGSAYRINRLVANQDHLYVTKYDGLYDLDGHTGRSPNLTKQLGHVVDSENGVAAYGDGGYVFMGHRKGLARVETTGLDYGRTLVVQPGLGLPNETPVRGIVTALTSEGGWTVAAVYNGTDTYVCWGRDHGGEVAHGPSPMLWHGGLIRLASQRCYLLHISNLTTTPTLWVGAGDTVKWCKLPRTEHPLQDSEYEFATSYSLYLPGQDWGRIATPKNLLQIDVEGDNLGVGVELAINYAVDGNSAYSLFGTAATSPQAEVLPSSEIVGRRIGFRLDGTGSVTAGANVRGLLLRSASRVRTRAIRYYQVLLAYGEGDRLRGPDHRDPETVWLRLQALETGQQIQVRDEFGRTLTCLLHAPAERVELEEKLQDGKSRLVMVANLTVSVLRRLGSGARWGDGQVWGGGRVWGGTVS